MSHNRDLSAAAAQIGFNNSNIGIGTDVSNNPSGSKLVIGGRIQSNAGGYWFSGANGAEDGWHVQDSGGNLLVVESGVAERLRITSAGNIGIGVNPTNVLDVEGTTHSKILIGTTGTGHATGLQITHAKGNAAEQMWQLQTDGSSDGNLKIRNATSNVDTMFFDADNNNIGVNIANPERKLEVVDTNSNGSYPLAVSNFINSTANKGAAIDFRLTTGGNTRGELGCKWTSNSSSDGTYFYIAPNDGTTGNIERLRISGDGNMGLGVSPSYSGVFGGSQRVLHIGGTTAPGLRIQSSTSNQGDFIIQAGNSGGATYLSNLSNNADTVFYNTSGGSIAEKMRIRAGGMITTPDQPAFNSKLSTATGQNFNGILVFNTVQYNIGSHYNGTNGRFTAPVDGRYLFNWYTNVDTNSNTTSLWGDWLINGNYSGFRFYTYVSHGGWEMLTASIIFDLNTNDYVNVFVSTSGNYDGGQYGSFNGCLLG